ILYRLRGNHTTEELITRGMVVGKNFNCMNDVILDPDHCWLIEIGNDVTVAPRVHILCHDASTKHYLGYTKIANVKIGNNVFIGAESVVMPGVVIGDNVIIGANSTVTHSVPANSVVVGSPARVICSTEEYIEKERSKMAKAPCFSEAYTLRQNVSMKRRYEMKKALEGNKGYVE
ncbi:DapH/DapD/GlmU-related protein, partial [Faecalicatena contorta]|uniref:DapH/DapD/GlmU-related protein n=1 Tax=Faecalicatena contorta TaxID=39482 RepID=UPI001F30D0C8